jgi:small subunit ribosomal protein S21
MTHYQWNQSCIPSFIASGCLAFPDRKPHASLASAFTKTALQAVPTNRPRKRGTPHESHKILWLDRLTVVITTGSITASQTTRKKRNFMPEVIVRKGEPIDRALKRLKNKLDAEGIMEEVRRLRAFETPSQKLRRKAKLAAKRGKLKFRFNP